MLAVARELNNSETAFVLPPDGPDHDVQVRFFTPTTEVPTCGHATVATHVARAVEHELPAGSVVQKTGTGLLQRVDVRRVGSRIDIGMHQGVADFGPELDGEQVDRLLAALAVPREDLVDAAPAQIVSTGHSKVLVELRSRAVVDQLQPDLAALKALSPDVGCNGFFVFTRSTGDPRLLTWSRMFAPAIGIPEDPVTGNGHGPLGAYLLRYGLAAAPDQTLRFVGRQGWAMGRPGDVQVSARIRSGGDVEVSIAGTAVIAFRAALRL
jgi:PhzF family phenazine biosynthesis protein